MRILGMIGGQEILIILLIVLVLFGGRKIPELMRGLGKGVREYKKAVNNLDEELHTDETGERNETSDSSSKTEGK